MPLIVTSVILAAFAVTPILAAEPAPVAGRASARVDWAAMTKAPSYERATAHAPRFDDEAVWPFLTGKEAYVRQSWPQGRLYVWRHPGESGGGKRSVHDPKLPANWLEGDKPAEKLVFDENTDLLIPPAEAQYSVNLTRDHRFKRLRHLTVSRNASFWVGGDGVGRHVFGSIWIKRGGYSPAGGGQHWVGDRHVFVRNDNSLKMPEYGHERFITRTWEYQRLGQYLLFSKSDGASVEVLGVVDCLDEFRVDCPVVVGPDSMLQPGRNCSPVVNASGAITLCDGARFGSWINNFDKPDIEVKGKIQAGIPERPLTRNATWWLCFKNSSRAQFNGDGHWKEGYRTAPSATFGDGAELSSHSANGSKLVVALNPYSIWAVRIHSRSAFPGLGSEGLSFDKANSSRLDYATKGHQRWYKSLPRHITLEFAEGVTVKNVMFDNVDCGGLKLADPADAARWKGVALGSNSPAKDVQAALEAEAPTGSEAPASTGKGTGTPHDASRPTGSPSP